MTKPKHPCGVCNKAVTRRSSAIQCEGECEKWFHTKCILMSSGDYKDLGNSSVVWICNNCGMHNIGLTNISSYSALDLNSTSINTFNHLANEEEDDGGDDEDDETVNDITPIGSPITSSSPKIPRKRCQKRLKHPSLKILNVNCQSVRAKKQAFHVLAEIMTQTSS